MVVVSKNKNAIRYEIRPSRKGAITGAVTEIAIGRFLPSRNGCWCARLAMCLAVMTIKLCNK